MSHNFTIADEEDAVDNKEEVEEPNVFGRFWQYANGDRDTWWSTTQELADDVDRAELTKEEYMELNKQLLESRRKIKGRMAETTQDHATAQVALLDTYKRLSLFARERDTNVWKVSDWNDLHKGHETEDGKDTFGGIHTFVSSVSPPAQQGGPEADKERLRKGDEAQLNVLGNEIEKELVILSDSEKALEQQQQSFSVFLNDQGRVLALIEKATAQSTNRGNDFKRSQMYKTIVKALDTSPALLQLDPLEAQNERATVHAVLRQLEQCEARTDELIQRILLKISALHRVEKSSSETIEEQITQQEGMNDDLDDLTDKIQENNESVKERTKELKTDILSTVTRLRKGGKMQMLGMCLCLIFVVCFVGFGFFVYLKSSGDSATR